MVKAYYRYNFERPGGGVVGKDQNIVHDNKRNLIYSACLQYVQVLNPRTQECKKQLFHKNIEITRLEISHGCQFLVSGHEDGDIVIWDLENDFEMKSSLNAHKAAVTTMAFNEEDNILASGSQDTTIILWDIISETSLFQ